VVASVKAVACELPAQLELPFSRFSINEIRQVIEQRIVSPSGRRRCGSGCTTTESGRGLIEAGSSRAIQSLS
jgi:hypothetical protein